MKVFNKIFKTSEYTNNQIFRSNIKYEYCKVSIKHVINWKTILEQNLIFEFNNICCLGTRNGREIDLFRIVFFYKYLIPLIRLNEIKKNGFSDLLPFLLSFNRSCITDKSSVVGVEINPRAKRKDTLIQSFDNLPINYEKKFNLVYSNSFDHSQDPEKTSIEWKKIIKKNGILIISFSNKSEPTKYDPLGNLNYKDIIKLFPGNLIYYNKSSSNYEDFIIQF